VTGAEFRRPVRTERIGPDGLSVEVTASEVECAALAARMAIPGVRALLCRFVLTAEPSGVFRAEAELQARLLRTCIISLEDFETAVAEHFTVRFVPAGAETADIDPESEDEIPYDQGTLDLGEAAAEQLALGLDPYPRCPGAELPPLDAGEATHPFAALASRRRAD
jgi:uncharacterized metal-binding protein YceD (DUF177 family)